MAQFGAIMRSFGIRYGYYDPKDWKAARYCDPIVDTWGDMMNAVAAFAFAQDDEGRNTASTKLLELSGKFNMMVEKGMVVHKGKFVAGANMTIADFVMASYIGNFLKNANNPLAP